MQLQCICRLGQLKYSDLTFTMHFYIVHTFPHWHAASTTLSSGTYDCDICSAGKYCPSASTSQLTCALGTFCPSGTGLPVACIAGFYCSTPAVAPTQCIAGTYCPVGSTSATPCPAGWYASAGSSACTKCPRGLVTESVGSFQLYCRSDPHCTQLFERSAR